MKTLLTRCLSALVPLCCVCATGFAAILVASNDAQTETPAVGEQDTPVLAEEFDSEPSPQPTVAETAPAAVQADPSQPMTAAAAVVDYRTTLQVALDEDNAVNGVMVFDGETMERCAFGTASFVQGETAVASVTADDTGEFTIPGLPVGTYSVTASSEFGSYMYLVDVVPHAMASAETEPLDNPEAVPVKFVAAPSEPSVETPQVLILRVPGAGTTPGDGTYPQDPRLLDGGPLPLPAGGGYSAGGGGSFIGGGGGGGYAGGGGGAGILLGAGLAGGAAALLNDDDDSPRSDSPAFP